MTHQGDMTHSCVWHDSSIRVTQLIHRCEMTHFCVSKRGRKGGKYGSYVGHDSSIRVTSFIYVCPVTHSYVSHVSHVSQQEKTGGKRGSTLLLCDYVLVPPPRSTSATASAGMWVMSHIWRSHLSYLDRSCPKYKRVMSHIWRSHCHFQHIKKWVYTELSLSLFLLVWSHVPHINESCPT